VERSFDEVEEGRARKDEDERDEDERERGEKFKQLR
jgi:hypothetical protein